MRLIAIAGLVIASFLATTAMATNYTAGSLAIGGPWSRAAPMGAQTAIGYMNIKNNGFTADRLIGVIGKQTRDLRSRAQ